MPWHNDKLNITYLTINNVLIFYYHLADNVDEHDVSDVVEVSDDAEESNDAEEPTGIVEELPNDEAGNLINYWPYELK